MSCECRRLILRSIQLSVTAAKRNRPYVVSSFVREGVEQHALRARHASGSRPERTSPKARVCNFGYLERATNFEIVT